MGEAIREEVPEAEAVYAVGWMVWLLCMGAGKDSSSLSCLRCVSKLQWLASQDWLAREEHLQFLKIAVPKPLVV